MGTDAARRPFTLREAVAVQALSPESDPALIAAVERLAAAAGDTLEAVVFFGSRRTGAARANAFSAYDLFAIVSAYRAFYDALRCSGLSAKSPGLLALASRWLPPTQISLRVLDPALHAKVSVIETSAFLRETSARRRDHFTIGRLFQPSRVVHARSEAARERALDGLVSAHAETWLWARPWLPARFDAEAYARRALEISLSWEIRPEPPGRALALWNAQREAQLPVFTALLAELEARGELRRAAPGQGELVPVRPVSPLERLRLRAYFSLSIVRATARWSKHMVSFEGWLDYIVRKASRHSGEPIELSQRERRWPLLFLWGRAFRFLKQRSGRR
jgi:hypothetical protein